MPIGAAIGAAGSIGSSLIGGYFSSRASDKAADAQRSALALQQQMFQQAQANFRPFIDTGKGAVLSLAQLYGINGDKPGGTPFGPEALNAFRNSPDYQFALSEGMRALTNANSGAGVLGRTHLDTVSKFNQGLATQNFGNYSGRLFSLADLGNRAATAAGQGLTMQGQVLGNTMTGIGQSEAAGQLGIGSALQNAWGGITNALGQYNMMNRNISSFGQTGALPPYGGNALAIPRGYQPVGALGAGGWVNPDYAAVGGGYGMGGVY